MPRSSPSRPRRRNRWQALNPEELQAQAAERRAIGTGGPLPWQPHPTLVALQERLQLVAGCWNLLDGTGKPVTTGPGYPRAGRSPRWPSGSGLPMPRPSGFFCDALRTYAWMLASVQWRRLPRRLGY